MGRAHDIILFYAKGRDFTLNRFYHEHTPEYIDSFFRHTDERGIYKLENLTSPSPRPNLTYPYKGFPPPEKGWRVSQEKMQQLDAENRLHFPSKADGRIMRKVYLHELEGQPMTDLWADIDPLSAHDKERLGYPTQKPLALLERIIAASSNPGDVVLDPFCGCGTAIAAAQGMDRKWLGIDITHLSVALLKYRLENMYELKAGRDYQVIGEPEDLGSAQQLARDDRYQFQWWALSLVRAKPLGGAEGERKGKKGSDKGIDGVITFVDSGKVKTGRVLVQVKSGHVKSGDIRDLVGTVGREDAQIGLFITLEAPTRDMITEAVSAGFYTRKLGASEKRYPKIQIATIADLLAGRLPDLPEGHGTFKQAERVNQTDSDQLPLL